MQREWLGDFIEDRRIDFVIGTPPNEVGSQLYRLFTLPDLKLGNRAVRCQRPEIILDPFIYGNKVEEGKALIEVVLDGSKQAFLAMGCTADSLYRWERMLQNEKNIERGYSIHHLFKKFTGDTAIVLGAGPSVQGFIDHYDSLKDKALIIACDAVLPLLIKNNIKPHIVTRCERKLTRIFGNLTREDTKGIWFATYPWIAPELYDLFDNILNLFRSNGVCTWSKWDAGHINGGVSSANAALEIAFELGCKDIVLAGIDLCFLDNRTHIEGTQVEFDPEKSKSKWKEIQGNSGKVTSIPVWIRCLHEYEGQIDKHGKEFRVYNTSLNGARITGTIVKPWFELKDKFKDFDFKSKEVLLQRTQFKSEEYKTFTELKNKSTEDLELILKELEKSIGNVQDQYLLSLREEQKLIHQLFNVFEPSDYWQQQAVVKNNLKQAFEECCRQVDSFKQRWYNHPLFKYCLLDITQLSYFTSENAIGSLINTIELEHERLKVYVKHNMNMWGELRWLLIHLVNVMKNGVNHETDCTTLNEATFELQTIIQKTDEVA